MFCLGAMRLRAQELAEERTITLASEFTISESLLAQSGTLSLFLENECDESKKRRVVLRDTPAATIEQIITFLKSSDLHKRLKNKALLNAIEHDVRIFPIEVLRFITVTHENKSHILPLIMPIIAFIKAADFLEIPLAVEFGGRLLAKALEYLSINWHFLKLELDKSFNSELADTIISVTRRYCTLFDHRFTFEQPRDDGYSVQHYIDYHEKKIDISGAGILRLEKLGLNSLKGLENLKQIDPRLDLADISILRCKENPLKEIPVGTFTGFSGLTDIDLSQCTLTELSQETLTELSTLPKLKWLSLHFNNFSEDQQCIIRAALPDRISIAFRAGGNAPPYE